MYVPPSTGKTFFAFRIAYARCGTKPDLNGQFYENTVRLTQHSAIQVLILKKKHEIISLFARFVSTINIIFFFNMDCAYISLYEFLSYSLLPHGKKNRIKQRKIIILHIIETYTIKIMFSIKTHHSISIPVHFLYLIIE